MTGDSLMDDVLAIIGDLEVNRRMLIREIKARGDRIEALEQRISELEEKEAHGDPDATVQ